MDLRTSIDISIKKKKNTNISMEKKKEYRTTNGMYKNNMWKISNTECKSI